MSSARDQPSHGFPAVPSTLNAADYEMRRYPDDQSTHPNTTPYYTPYLGLRARLSQVWMNRWTILLILILCRLLLSIASIDGDLASAKTEALSACNSVERAGSAMASMPHYLSTGVNALAADGVTQAVEALMDMLMLSITAVEEIVLFIINMMTSTYVCLITLAVSGSLHVAIDMIEKVGDFMNQTIGDITGEMSGDVKDFQDTLNGFLKGVSIPAGLFGGSSDPPQIDLTSQIAALNGITIDPTQMDAELTKLNASIPTFEDVHNFTNSIIRLPFEEVKKLINQTISGYTFDRSVFPVAQRQELSFCSDNSAINDFFNGLVDTIYAARRVFLGVLIVLAILACVPVAYFEIRRWRRMQQRSQLLQKNAFDPMDVVYIASRPFSTTIGIKAASKFKSTKRQILTRWFVAYATSLPALFVLSLGLAGLFSCLCQYIVLKTIEREVPALAEQVGDFSADVVFALNNASEAWAVDANGVIKSTNTELNEELFGWVNTSTTAVNQTLNVFSDEMNKALNKTFGGTILYDPIKGVMNCLVELKIAGIQKGLTWVHDNAHINFPEFRPDVFSLGAAASVTNTTSDDAFLASPGDVASDSITSAVVKVSLKLQDAIQTEAIISTCVIGIWFLIMLIGLGRVLLAMMTRDKTRAEGGPVGYTGDQRAPLSPRSPNRNNTAVFPEFGVPVSSIHPKSHSDDQAWGHGGLVDEKLGDVGNRTVVAAVQPGHQRSSSYGYLDDKR